jgi:2-C-methyl-D-erythritol 4-phosphate cytidylyltransferase
MRADVPKQYLPLAGTTVIEQTLDLLLRIPSLVSITVAVSAGDPFWSELKISRHSSIITVEGGNERAASVLNGLKELRKTASDDDWVLVHDAARPCVSGEEIVRLINACQDANNGGILAAPVHDTMKRSDGNNRIAETVSRENLWHAYTPQMFRLDELIKAISGALDAGFTVTDEASAMEWAGQQPLLVECSSANIKITRPDDLALAEFYLRRE